MRPAVSFHGHFPLQVRPLSPADMGRAAYGNYQLTRPRHLDTPSVWFGVVGLNLKYIHTSPIPPQNYTIPTPLPTPTYLWYSIWFGAVRPNQKNGPGPPFLGIPHLIIPHTLNKMHVGQAMLLLRPGQNNTPPPPIYHSTAA